MVPSASAARSGAFIVATFGFLGLFAPLDAQVPARSPLDPGASQALDGIVPEPRRNPSFGLDKSDNPGGILLHSGEFVYTSTDLTLKGRDMGFHFTRTYRSANHRGGPLGVGWDANVFRHIEELGNGDVFASDGRGRTDTYQRLPGGEYQAPIGFYSALKKVPGGFLLRAAGGKIETYSNAGRLASVEDRNGNRHDYAYDRSGKLQVILDEFGRRFDFNWGSGNLLTSIVDFDGRELRFEYQDNLLTSVRSPLVVGTPDGNDFPNGKREQYQYDSQADEPGLRSNLLAIVAPNEVESASGVARIVNTFGAADNDERVIRQQVGGTAEGRRAGGVMRFHYEFDPVGGPAGSAERTRVWDRKGQVSDYYHNAAGQALEVRIDATAPSPFVTQFEYNGEGEIQTMVLPEGNLWNYTYDSSGSRFSAGNCISAVFFPDPLRGASQPSLATTTTYDALYQRPLTITEPRGNDASYVPQNGGTQSAARYTTVFTYDWQEAATLPAEASEWNLTIPGGLLGLGDRNGDGLTNQRSGNLVRVDYPIVQLLPSSRQALLEGDTTQEIVTRFEYNSFGQLVSSEDPRGNLNTHSYFPEEDPDGDGQGIIENRNGVTGGYLAVSIEDAFIGPRRLDPGPALVLATTFERDVRGNVIMLTDARGLEHRSVYNSLDQLVQTEEPKVDLSQSQGYLRHFHYDANDNLVREETENWREDGSGAPIQDGTHPEFENRYLYDILDNLIETCVDAARGPDLPASSQPEELVTKFFYDGNENRVLVETPVVEGGTQAHNTTDYLFDERDLCVRTTRGEGSAEPSSTIYEYDRNGNRTSWTDAVDDDSNPGGESEQFEYDGYDRMTGCTDRAGNERVTTYDAADQVLGVTWLGPVDGQNPAPVELQRTATLYDELGRAIRFDQELFLPAGPATTHPLFLGDGPLTPGDDRVSQVFEYDENSRRTHRIDDDGALYESVYDAADRMIEFVLPLQAPDSTPNSTRFIYDENDNVVRTEETHVSPEGLVPTVQLNSYFVFDELDRMVRSSDPLGQTSYFEYDSRSNTVMDFDQRGPLVSDPLGLVPGLINERGNPRNYFHDGANRLWREVQELHVGGVGSGALDLSNPAVAGGLIVLDTEYDANSRVVRRSDGGGNATTYVYDALDRCIGIDKADGGVHTATWDADDRITGVVDENGTSHSYVYDGLDRLIAHTIAPSTATIPGTSLPLIVGTQAQSFEYDGLSRLTRASNENEASDPQDDWILTRRFDSLSRVVEEVQNGRAVGCNYLADDRAALVYPNGRAIDLTFDAHDQPLALDDPGVFHLQTAYLGDCCPPIVRVATSFNPFPQNALVCNQVLNPAKLVVQSTLNTPGGIIGQQNLGRDRDNGLTSQDLVYTAAGNATQVNFQWTRNSIDQLELEDRQEQLNAGPPTARLLGVQYGPAQEMLEVSLGGVPIASQSFGPTYKHTSGALIFDDGSGTGSGLRSKDANFLYQSNGFGLLEVVRDAADPNVIVAEYDYDASPGVVGGRRVEAEVSNSGALDGVTRFYYDGLHVIEETDASAPLEILSAQFFYGYRGMDDVLAMDVDLSGDGITDQLFYYGRDVNGNVTHLVDGNGVPKEFYEYESLGLPQVIDPVTLNTFSSSQFHNPYLFQGRRFDAETELYYFRSRYLDPQTGEFLSRDSMGLWGDSMNDGNPTAFVGNDPWNATDPMGREGWLACLGAGIKKVASNGLSAAAWVVRGMVAFPMGESGYGKCRICGRCGPPVDHIACDKQIEDEKLMEKLRLLEESLAKAQAEEAAYQRYREADKSPEMQAWYRALERMQAMQVRMHWEEDQKSNGSVDPINDPEAFKGNQTGQGKVGNGAGLGAGNAGGAAGGAAGGGAGGFKAGPFQGPIVIPFGAGKGGPKAGGGIFGGGFIDPFAGPNWGPNWGGGFIDPFGGNFGAGGLNLFGGQLPGQWLGPLVVPIEPLAQPLLPPMPMDPLGPLGIPILEPPGQGLELQLQGVLGAPSPKGGK